jgi:EmrB/QacA subfamily drug resistance transporter
MEQVDATVIATALPAIAVDLAVDPIALKLAFTAYLLGLAIFIPASGWAADRFGARAVFSWAIVVFTIGSNASGFSSTLEEFVAARVLQGVGGAMMTPVGRLVVIRSAPRSELVNLMAWLTIPSLLGPMMGPPLGGFIVTFFDWRWIFWINVPVGIVGFILARLFVPDFRAEEPGRFDALGFVLLGTGLSGLVFGLSVFGQAFVPMEASLVLLAIGFTSTALYVWHARRAARPLLDLALFKYRTLFTGVVGGFLFRIGIGSIPFLLPLMLQLGLGLTAFETGMLTFAGAGGALLMKFTAAPIVRRFGFKPVLVANGVISSAFIAATGLFIFGVPHSVIIVVLLVGGFFRSLQFTSLNVLSYADVPEEQTSRATSLSSVSQQVALSTGVAVAAFILETLRSMNGDHTIALTDYMTAFFIVGAISLIPVFIYLRLPADAGASMSGRRQPPAAGDGAADG